MLKTLPFEEASSLTESFTFDAEFDETIVHTGAVKFEKNATGADLLKKFGLKKQPEATTLFIIDGDLVIDGGLHLDAKLDFSLAVLVTGKIAANALRVDQTLLYGAKGANIKSAIFFETNDGTLVIQGKTECPLVLVHDGDIEVEATGKTVNTEDDDLEELFVSQAFDDGEYSSDKAWKRAAKGESLLKPVKPAKPSPKGLETIKMVEAKNIVALASDGTNVWVGADHTVLMLEKGKITRTWRHQPEGTCDQPTNFGVQQLSLVKNTLVASGQNPNMSWLAPWMETSDDLGVTWKLLSMGARCATATKNGVAFVKNGTLLASAATFAGPWKETRIAEDSAAITATSAASVGDSVWISGIEGKQAVLIIVTGDQVKRANMPKEIFKILPIDGGVLLLGKKGLVLRADSAGNEFAESETDIETDIRDAIVTNDAIYAVGGDKKTGFVARASKDAANWELLETKIAGQLRAVVAVGGELIFGGDGKVAFSRALS